MAWADAKNDGILDLALTGNAVGVGYARVYIGTGSGFPNFVRRAAWTGEQPERGQLRLGRLRR